MNPNTFDTLVYSLKENDSADNKMHTMKVTIGAAGAIAASQVVRLLKLLPSDDDKLEMAKTAFGYVIDRETYVNTVSETFSSNDSKASFNEYIHRHW